jgi:uncharacterized membrane protein YeiB
MQQHSSETLRIVRDDSDPPQTDDGKSRADATSTRRIVAIDLVRALALYGMFTINTGAQYDWMTNGVPGWLSEIPHGRSSSTFALLAGISLALIAGGRAIKTGRDRRQAMAKIAVRAVILIVLGIALVAAGATIPLILISYGLFFLLALPFTRLGFRGLAITAGIFALLGPVAKTVSRSLLPNGLLEQSAKPLEGYLAYDPIVQLGELFGSLFGGVLNSGWERSEGDHFAYLVGYELPALLTYGFLYSACVFMAYITAGMAIGRLDLGSTLVRIRMAVVGPALMLLGYGTAAILALAGTGVAGPLHIGSSFIEEDTVELPEGTRLELDKLWDQFLAGDITEREFIDAETDLYPEFAYTEPDIGIADLFAGSSHSGGVLEVLGNIGFSITMIVLFMVLLDRLQWLRIALTPLIAVGSMTLTAYVIQAVALPLLQPRDEEAWEAPGSLLAPVTGAQNLLWLMIVTTTVAFVWSRFSKRGPLEYLMYSAGKLGRLVK